MASAWLYRAERPLGVAKLSWLGFNLTDDALSAEVASVQISSKNFGYHLASARTWGLSATAASIAVPLPADAYDRVHRLAASRRNLKPVGVLVLPIPSPGRVFVAREKALLLVAKQTAR